MYRLQIFIDFWNFMLSMKDKDSEGGTFLTDWRKLPSVLLRETANLTGVPATYQGMNVYGSYDEINPKDMRLYTWATKDLATSPGVNVSFVPRMRTRNAPRCPKCYAQVEICPSCGEGMRGTEEKGVDVRIATDMIRLAWEQNYDVAVLVSADQDFVPVAEFLQMKGIKVIHGAFPPYGAELTQRCWGHIEMLTIKEDFRRHPG